MNIKKLDPTAIETGLKNLSDWQVKNEKLHREYKFADFKTAFQFMTLCAQRAEELDHHPEWFNVYNKVIVDLTTHDAQGISESDFILARSMNEFANNLS